MNEVKAFAAAGERAGAALGTGVRTARRSAKRARKQLAKHMPDSTTEMTKKARKAREAAQAALAERLLEARHELASRIEPEPPRRRRWLWLTLLFVVVGGIAGAAVLARRPREIEPEEFDSPPPTREPGSRDSDPDASWGAQAGNGAVSAERPSTSTD